MDRLLWYVFAGSRGGPTRLRIVRALLEGPRNLHQLAKELELDYKTVEYNVRVLAKHVLVVCPYKGSYGAMYQASKDLLANMEAFEKIAVQAKRQEEKRARKRARRAAGPGRADEASDADGTSRD